MRVSDAAILIVPGLGGSGPEHWQTRWQAKLSTAQRVEQSDWENPGRDAWVESLVAGAAASSRPAVIVAHSLGVVTTAMAAPRLAGRVIGAFLVAPPDCEDASRVPAAVLGFAPVPHDPLPFPSVLVASADDPYCSAQRASDFADAWGSDFVDAGAAGHINPEAGYGPWPEGLMRLAGFLSRLG